MVIGLDQILRFDRNIVVKNASKGDKKREENLIH